MAYAEDGDLSRFEAVEIAAATGWQKDPETFLKALQDVRLLDDMVIHDWMDYAGRLVEKRIANRERMRDARATNVQRTNGERAGATVPNRTKPKDPSPSENPKVGSQGKGTGSTPAPRKPDPIWDTLVDTFGLNPVTTEEQKRLGKVVSALKKKGATPDQIRLVYAEMEKKEWTPFSPEGLLKWFDTFSKAPTPKASVAPTFTPGMR